MTSMAQHANKTTPGAGVWLIAVIVVAAVGWAAFTGFDRIAGGEDRVQWIMDVKQGVAQAHQSGKPQLVYFTASWCVPCHDLKRFVFSDETLAELINTQFVPVKVDMTFADAVPAPDPAMQRRNNALAVQLGVTGYPTLIVRSPAEKVLSHRPGPVPKALMYDWLTQIIAEHGGGDAVAEEP